jgi:uncharacterized protein (DUF1330 family)
MSAYVEVELTVIDAEAMDAYRALAVPAVQEYGGQFVARSAAPEQLEGTRVPDEQVIVIEFESAAAAREWYGSEAYGRALAVCDQAMTRRMTLVEGVR